MGEKAKLGNPSLLPSNISSTRTGLKQGQLLSSHLNSHSLASKWSTIETKISLSSHGSSSLQSKLTKKQGSLLLDTSSSSKKTPSEKLLTDNGGYKDKPQTSRSSFTKPKLRSQVLLTSCSSGSVSSSSSISTKVKTSLTSYSSTKSTIALTSASRNSGLVSQAIGVTTTNVSCISATTTTSLLATRSSLTAQTKLPSELRSNSHLTSTKRQTESSHSTFTRKPFNLTSNGQTLQSSRVVGKGSSLSSQSLQSSRVVGDGSSLSSRSLQSSHVVGKGSSLSSQSLQSSRVVGKGSSLSSQSLQSSRVFGKGSTTLTNQSHFGGKGSSAPSTQSVKSTVQTKGKVEDEEESRKIPIMRPITADTEGAPKYNFSTSSSLTSTRKPLQFVSPSKDASLQTSRTPAANLVELKITLLNSVSSSLLASPDFHDYKDPSLLTLGELGEKIACHDPEFVLKVAIYTRLNLNIRTTANFLLALAAKLPNCRPFLKKYFSATVRLPSDWIEVAEIYQALHDTNIKFGSIPTALRKVMGTKFTEFDAYQLAKYNKDGSKKKKKTSEEKVKKTQKKEELAKEKYATDFPALKKEADESESDDSESDDSVVLSDSERKEELERLSFTLKQLIRKIHISAPVEYVMCLVGKKYPEDTESFRKSRLPGLWEQEKAGKRMKLPVPETWETQVSTKGNKSDTWESLIDHNKLPFMAMLRNIRNLILAGVTMKHHQWVMKKLGDERAVTNSKQFPFRFFSAYQVLEDLEKIASGETVPSRAPSKGKGGKGKGGKKKMSKKPPKVMPSIDQKLLHKYKTALDTALKIATCYNVKPIRGKTLILCNVGSSMDRPCTAAKGLGKPRTVFEIGILLGLMCKYSCESSTMLTYGRTGAFTEVELKDGTILHNMQNVMDTATSKNLTDDEGSIPIDFLTNCLIDRQHIDNIVLLTDAMKLSDHQGKAMMAFLQKYRHLVNPNLLFVSVDLSAGKTGVSSTIQPQHPNDIYLAGYSDQILRFIAERGDAGQLTYVDNIDKAYNLTNIVAPSLADTASSTVLGQLSSEKVLLRSQKWRTVRVFISSTFRDMHGERDLLTRFVFPELRARAHSRQIHIYEVDLRWGVTEQDARSHKALEICLNEISRSQYFIGLLGQRYGWIQEEYEVPDTPEFDWLKELPKRKSITEVEMYHAALSDADKAVNKVFFYFRDPSFLNKGPALFKEEFESESEEAETKIENLKSDIRESGLEVYDNYSCKWLGKVQDKLMVGGLESFGQRVLYNLWNAIQKDFPEDDIEEDAITQSTAQHSAFEEVRASTFTGRRALLLKAKEVMDNPDNKLLLVTGKPGCGKSAFMASLAQQYSSASNQSVNVVISHFVGAAPGSTNVALLLTRICHEMKRRFGVSKPVPEEYTDLAKEWSRFLEESVVNVGKLSCKIVILIDGVDLLEDKHNARSLDWIPKDIPEGVMLVISGVEGGMSIKQLKKKNPPPVEVVIGHLDMFDKAEMVRNKLAKHRKLLDESPFNNQMKLLLTKKEAINPLYLHLACEELRVFGVFEEVTTYLKKMPTTTSSLLQEILSRLETEHTPEILSTALILLTLVRNGLLEYELAGVLELAGKELYSEAAWSLPPMMMAKLIRNLQTFLQPTGEENISLLVLAHKDIEKAVKMRYLRGAGSSKESQLHLLLSKFFRAGVDPAGDGSFSGNSGRAFTELPHHLLEAGAWNELEQLLCNINFVVSKCQLGLSHQLLENYTLTAEGLPSGKARELTKFIQQPTVQQFKSFVSRNLHILLHNPSLALQQALNEPSSSIIASSARDMAKEQCNSMVAWINKPETTSPCQMNISSGIGAVHCVDVSLDSSLFVAGFNNGGVKVYEVMTGKEVHTFIGHAAAITAVCFVGTNFVCSASHDTTLSLWQLKEGVRVASMRGHSRGVFGCAANKSGKTIASVSWDRTIKVWEGSTGKLQSTLKTQGQHNTPINCVSFHPEGQLIVVGSWDRSLKIWDTFNEKRLKVLKGHKSSVQACTYAPSGRHIVSAALDGEVKIWATKSYSAVGTITGHHSPVNAIAFTPNGQHLVTGSSDKVIKVWSGNLGQPVTSVGTEELGFVHRLVFDHQNNLVSVGYHDGHIRQFNLQTGVEVFSTRPHQAAIVGLAQQTDLFMSASVDGSIKVWDSGSPQKAIELKGHTAPITCAVWDKNGFASASEDFTILVWPHDAKTYSRKFLTKKAPVGKKRKTKGQHPQPVPTPTQQALEVTSLFQFEGHHTGKITAIAFSHDGLKMAVGGHDRKITLWNCLSHKLLRTMESCHKDWITALSFSDISPELLITGSSDFTLKSWDISSGAEKLTFKGHTSAINAVSFSQGCVVSAAFDGSVKVWTHKGVEITTMFCHKQRVNACHLHIPSRAKANQIISNWADVDDDDADTSPNKLEEILVLTGSDDGTVAVWKPFLPNERTSFIGHSDHVLSVATTLNNQILSSSLDGSIRTWNIPQPVSILTSYQVHTGPVTCLSALSAEGEEGVGYLVSGGRDGCVTVCKTSGKHLNKLYQVKHSNKAVSSVCFTSIQKNSESGMFLVGDDSGAISFYSFSQQKATQKGTTIGADALMGTHPVSKLLAMPDGKNVVAGSWSSKIAVVRNEQKTSHYMEMHQDWVTDITASGQSIYSIGLDNNLIVWDLPKTDNAPKQPVTMNGARKFPLRLSSPQQDKRGAVWPLSLCVVQNTSFLAISDSQGQVCLWNRKTFKLELTQKLHRKQVNVVTSLSDGCFMSGSDDGTVKIWRVEGTGRTVGVAQIGQFYCQSCVTAITGIRRGKNSDKSLLTVGDSLGNLYLLQWNA